MQGPYAVQHAATETIKAKVSHRNQDIFRRAGTHPNRFRNEGERTRVRSVPWRRSVQTSVEINNSETPRQIRTQAMRTVICGGRRCGVGSMIVARVISHCHGRPRTKLQRQQRSQDEGETLHHPTARGRRAVTVRRSCH